MWQDIYLNLTFFYSIQEINNNRFVENRDNHKPDMWHMEEIYGFPRICSYEWMSPLISKLQILFSGYPNVYNL